MKFTKDGVTYEVRDQAHIDCFKAKGWKPVEENAPAVKQAETKPKK